MDRDLGCWSLLFGRAICYHPVSGAGTHSAAGGLLMEAVIFIGLQATGKSSFYLARFFHSHIRINLDMLKTRRREELLLHACLAMQQSFVVDNTNPTAEERARYIPPARAAGFRIAGYYFESSLGDAIRRNSTRAPEAQVPVKAIGATRKKLQLPTPGEGFDALYTVRIAPAGGFEVAPWAGQPA
jgi:predicted kinase